MRMAVKKREEKRSKQGKMRYAPSEVAKFLAMHKTPATVVVKARRCQLSEAINARQRMLMKSAINASSQKASAAYLFAVSHLPAPQASSFAPS